MSAPLRELIWLSACFTVEEVCVEKKLRIGHWRLERRKKGGGRASAEDWIERVNLSPRGGEGVFILAEGGGG